MSWSAHLTQWPRRRGIRVGDHLFQDPVIRQRRCFHAPLHHRRGLGWPRFHEDQFIVVQLQQRGASVFALLLLQGQLQEAGALAAVSLDAPAHAIVLRNGGLPCLEDPVWHPSPDQQGQGHCQKENRRSLSHLSLNYSSQFSRNPRLSMHLLLLFRPKIA